MSREKSSGREGDCARERRLPSCSLYRLRMATRRATRLYDEIMQPAGLGAAQFGVLMTLEHRAGATVTDLARALDMDRTTLTRNLQPLVRSGLAALSAGADKRSRSVQLTDEGRRRLTIARQLWRKAQNAVTDSLGAAETKALNELLAVAIERLP
jgi:DNA-binding MarR family transcriptional regulator